MPPARPSAPDGVTPAVSAWLRARVRLVGSAAAVGFALGVVALGALALRTGEPRFASTQVFALGALVLGFGVLGWSGSILVGDSVETAQRYTERRTDWTERDSRRAMARLSGAGAGAMLGVVATMTLLGG